jgi:hypothetical protein
MSEASGMDTPGSEEQDESNEGFNKAVRKQKIYYNIILVP